MIALIEEIKGDVRIIRLQGRINVKALKDIDTAEQLVKKVAKKKVIINLEQVISIDSTGLGFLVSVYKNVTSLDGIAVLSGPNDRIMALLELTRMVRVFDIYKTDEEALKSILNHV